MKNSITFKKLILLFSAVVIPFFLVSVLLLRQNNTAIRNRTFTSIQNKTDLTAQTLTNALEQIRHTGREVAEQTILGRLSTPNYPMTAYERAKDILLIQEQQTSIANANEYIANFIIYYQATEHAYNCNNLGKTSFFNFNQEEYQTLIDEHMASDMLTLHDGTLTEIILPSFGTAFLIRIDLSAESIDDLLAETFPEYNFYYHLDVSEGSYQITNLSKDQLTQASIENYSALPEPLSPDKLTLDGKLSYRFSADLPYDSGRICFYFSDDQLFADTQIYQYLTLCFILFVLLACCIFLWGSYMIIHKPIQTLINAFQNINNQNYNVRIFTQKNSDFTYLYREFNHMAKELGTLIEKDYQQQLLLNKAELKQLQAQINPHFLYNSLFLMRRMIQDELYEEAYHMSDVLGLYFQYITRNSQDYMPLSQEYNHAVLYCTIQKLRFEGRIHVETDVLPEEYADISVPKLIIQPLLENAFNYGLCNKVEDGLVKVTISSDDSKLFISVEDNGEELTDRRLEQIQNSLQTAATGNSLQEMTGILNIQRRLNIYWDGYGHLSASRSPLGGLCMRLIIPQNNV